MLQKRSVFCLVLSLLLIAVFYPAPALGSPRGQMERQGFAVEIKGLQQPPLEAPVHNPPAPANPLPHNPAPADPAASPGTGSGGSTAQRNFRSGAFMPAPAPAPVPDPVPFPPTAPALPDAPSWMTASEAQAFMLLNQYRIAHGIPPVQAHRALTEVARLKVRDMSENNYFAHNSPTYGSPGNMVRQAGIKFSALGENLSGAGNVQQAHAQLVYSAAHRQIMLNPNYHYVGIGIVPWKATPGIIMVQLWLKP